MAYPALIGYYQPPTDVLPPSVDLYYAPNGAERFHLHDHLETAHNNMGGDGPNDYRLPDFSEIDESPLESATDILSARDIALEELGDAIDYYDVYALYLQTPRQLYTYATVPLWPDINPLIAKGLTAAVYPGHAINDDGLKPNASPVASLDNESFQSPLDRDSDTFSTVANAHRSLIRNVKRIVTHPDFKYDPDDPPVIYTSLPGSDYAAAYIDRPQMFQNLTTDGALVRLNGGLAADTDQSISALGSRLLKTTNSWRTLYSQPVWEEHLKRLSEEQTLTGPDEQADEEAADPNQVAVNQAYHFTQTLLNEYGTEVSPLSADLFADEIATQTDSSPVDFVGQSAPEL
jgi:hypothetical protein